MPLQPNIFFIVAQRLTPCLHNSGSLGIGYSKLPMGANDLVLGLPFADVNLRDQMLTLCNVRCRETDPLESSITGTASPVFSLIAIPVC